MAAISEHSFYNALALRYRANYGALKKLRQRFSSWGKAYAATRDRETPDPEEAFAELEKFGIQCILREDKIFPAQLLEISWPPFALYVRGQLPKKWTPALAMVGTRKATPVGLRFAEQLAGDLARRGVIIISGLALGVDAASQHGAIAGGGITVAVLASGLDRITPQTNSRLGEQILQKGGAIISEYPIGTESVPRLFLERNRIVSGLSQAALIIEAPKRSGTLSTARFAIEQNRDVLVVPGGINNPNYEGSNELLKQGAQLVTGISDVLQTLGLDEQPEKATMRFPFLDDPQQKIMAYLTELGEPVHTDALSDALKISGQQISESLAMLTIMSIVKEEGGRYYI